MDDTPEIKSEKLLRLVRLSFNSYPRHALAEPFSILYATRFGQEFRFYKIFEGYGKEFRKIEIILPAESMNIYTGGSGKFEFWANWVRWENKKHNNFGMSRAVFHCMQETLETIKEPTVGGIPQIVGLYRKGNARLFGIIDKGKKYLFGKEVIEDIEATNIEWRNENFERMDPVTVNLIKGAQRQPR